LMAELCDICAGKVADPVLAKSSFDVMLNRMLIVPGGSRFTMVGNVFAQEPVSKIRNCRSAFMSIARRCGVLAASL
jgi:hypothetical protein